MPDVHGPAGGGGGATPPPPASAREERGSVTAEFALVLPVLVVLLALGAGLLSASSARVRLEDGAADAARVVGRGEGDGSAAAIVARSVPGAGVSIARDGDFVCVTATATIRIVGAIPAPMTARSCALDGGR